MQISEIHVAFTLSATETFKRKGIKHLQRCLCHMQKDACENYGCYVQQRQHASERDKTMPTIHTSSIKMHQVPGIVFGSCQHCIHALNASFRMLHQSVPIHEAQHPVVFNMHIDKPTATSSSSTVCMQH